MPLFTLQKASSCFHNLIHSDRERAEWYTFMPCLELQQHLKRRCKPLSVPIQNIQLIGNKIQSLMNLSLFAFCRGPITPEVWLTACSADWAGSWIIYCWLVWLVWCERKILFQLIIHDRLRPAEQAVYLAQVRMANLLTRLMIRRTKTRVIF